MSVKVTTGVARLSYAHIFEPFAYNEGDKPRYSATFIIPKSDTETINAINKAIDDAIDEGVGKGKFNGKKPNKQTLWIPLRDGDVYKEGKEEFSDSYYIAAKSDRAPKIVDRKLNDIIDPDMVYSGCYVKASLIFFPYDTQGGKGVSCILGNIQWVKDGEPFAQVSRPEEDFEPIDDDDDILG